MPFAPLLDEALRQTRRHFRAIFPAVAMPVALVATVAGVLQALDIEDLIAGGTRTLFWTPQILVLALLLAVLSMVAYVAGQVAALDALAGRPVDMGRAWRFALRARGAGDAPAPLAGDPHALLVLLLPAGASSSPPSSPSWCR